ncbi:hypothetical protein HDU88_000655 [Geranomyces variabilis]|nr:hypothetical protein HDU88_000655 [Geranomyces variabilis]
MHANISKYTATVKFNTKAKKAKNLPLFSRQLRLLKTTHAHIAAVLVEESARAQHDSATALTAIINNLSFSLHAEPARGIGSGPRSVEVPLDSCPPSGAATASTANVSLTQNEAYLRVKKSLEESRRKKGAKLAPAAVVPSTAGDLERVHRPASSSIHLEPQLVKRFEEQVSVAVVPSASANLARRPASTLMNTEPPSMRRIAAGNPPGPTASASAPPSLTQHEAYLQVKKSLEEGRRRKDADSVPTSTSTMSEPLPQHAPPAAPIVPPFEPPIESPVKEMISFVPETPEDPKPEPVMPMVSPPKSKPATLPSAIPVYNTVLPKPVLKLPPIIKRNADGPPKRKLEEIKHVKPATTRVPPPRRPPVLVPKPVKLAAKPPPRPEEITTIVDENGNLPEPDSDPSICSDESEDDDFDDASFDAGGDWIENTPERPRKTRRFKEPGWVATPELRKAIVMQERTDPDSVFGSARPALEDVFREGMTRKPTRAARDTEFTGEDCLTEAEIAAYNANMKYTCITSGARPILAPPAVAAHIVWADTEETPHDSFQAHSTRSRTEELSNTLLGSVTQNHCLQTSFSIYSYPGARRSRNTVFPVAGPEAGDRPRNNMVVAANRGQGGERLSSTDGADQHSTPDATGDKPCASRKVLAATSAVSNLWRYSLRETSRQKSQFCIGCCSVCLVVFAVALLMTVMAITPLIFLSLAERISGETDLTAWADWNGGFYHLNYTKAASLLADNQDYSYSTPRVSRYGLSLYAAKSCSDWSNAAPTDVRFTYQCGPSCIDSQCSLGTGVYAWLIDTERERDFQIGRAWSLPPVPKDGIYIGSRTARALKLSVGDYVILSDDAFMFGTLYSQVKASTITTPGFQDIKNVNIPLVVKAIYQEDGSNKWPQWTATDYNVVLEYSTILEVAAPYYHPTYPQAFRNALVAAGRNLAQYGEANQLIFVCGIPRTACYSDSNYGNIAIRLLAWGSKIRFRLGFDEVDVGLDVLGTLKNVSTFSQFLSLITSIVVALFVGLSCFLIYNLLMVSVETKTFELGILRMIGQTRGGVIVMILMQAATYAIPAWAVGLVLAQILFVVGKRFLENIANITISSRLTTSSIALATVLGIGVPAIAAILPIRQALSGNLRDALDKRHSKVKPVIITIERSGPGSLASILPNALTGLVLASVTFSIYYLVPKALVDNNLALLFNIFMALLLGMLLGMVMLSFNVQPMVEKIILTMLLILVFFENAAVHSLVAQNLVAHRMRNRKTATMFAFSLAFIIFLSVNLTVELDSMEFDKMKSVGAQIRIANADDPTGIGPLLVAQIETTLEAARPFVIDWSARSVANRRFDSAIQDTKLTNLGRIVTYDINIVAVTPNWFNIPEPDPNIFIVGESDPIAAGLSISEQLYTYKGQRSAAISTIMRQNLAIAQVDGRSNFSDAFLVKTTLSGSAKVKTQYNVLEPASFLDQAPYAVMTKFPKSARTTALVSFPTLVDLSNGRIASVDDIPIQSIHVALDTSSPGYASKLGELVDTLGDVVRGTGASVLSLKKEIDDIQSSRQLLSTIFNLATVLVMLITLFSLNGCMYTNITEQGKELGVLRALGVTKWGIFRVYTYEAFVLTSAAGVLGTLIGAAIGWSMAAQRSLMTQVPVGFPFPWSLAGIAILASLACSVVSTTGPVYALVGKRTIVSILRE